MSQENFELISYRNRFKSTVIDFLMFITVFLALYFTIFGFVFSNKNIEVLRRDTFRYSYLYVEKGGKETFLETNDYSEYETIVKKYYVGKVNETDEVNSYFTSEFYKKHGGTRTSKTIEWYNNNILGLKEGSSDYFELVDNDINKYGQIKSSCYEIVDGNKVLKEDESKLICNYFKAKYEQCFYDLYEDEFYLTATKKQDLNYKLRAFTSFIIPSMSIYLIVPLFNKNRTLGIFLAKGEIATKDGLYPNKLLCIVRYLPHLAFASLMMITSNVYIYFIAAILYFLLDFVLVSYTKKRQSFPCLISNTIVVSRNDSKLFHDIEEKNEYVKELEEKAENVSFRYYKNGE